MTTSAMRSVAPWWTTADESELEVLVNALVRAGFAHRSCTWCRELNAWCKPMREAAEAVFEWVDARWLLSRAQYLRALENRKERHERHAA
jgi:hypothetical protein